MSIKFSDIFSSVDDQKLEEVFNKTKDVAEVMGRKSAERIELSRKKVELLDAKAKLAKLYEKYGELNYDAFIGLDVDVAEMEEYACQIAEQKNKIDIYTEDIETAKAAFNQSMANAAKRTRDAFSTKKDEPDEVDVTVVDDDSKE